MKRIFQFISSVVAFLFGQGLVRRFSVAIIITIMGGISGAYAQAPKMCIPPAIGVPGQPGGPDWWTAGQNPNTKAYTPLDPRWRGAMSLDYGFGAQSSDSEVEFRALSDQQGAYLLLSWFIKTAPDLVADQTSLFLGLAPNQANPTGTIIKVVLRQSDTGIGDAWQPMPKMVGATTYYDVSVYTGQGTQSWSSGTTPAWVTDATRVWMNNSAGAGKNRWVVQMRVPLGTAGVNVGPNFKMWHYAQIDYNYIVDSSGTPIAPSALIPYTWPRTDSATTPVTKYVYYEDQQFFPQKPTFPAPDGWGEFSLQNPSTSNWASAGCGGISITTNDIGIQNGTGLSNISVNSSNTFFAKPTNTQTGAAGAVPANTLSAKFRFANWGIQVGDVTSTSWSSPSALTSVVDTGGIPAYSGTPGPGQPPQGNINGQWLLSAAEKCQFTGVGGVTDATNTFIPGNANCAATPNPDHVFDPSKPEFLNNPTRMLHQCMLVELNGPGQNFLVKSAFRNMNFVHASTFKREAEVSVVGLSPLPSGKRDVYLFIERKNMPSVITPPKDGGGVNPSDPKPPVLTLGASKMAVMDKKILADMPTYIVHGYYDTGTKITVNGKQRPIFLPQTSFGYWVQHEGALYGWDDSLEGAQQLGKDHYKLSVPNNGTVRIANTIVAAETPKPPKPPCQCGTICAKQASNDSDAISGSLILVGSLSVGGFAFLRRRRKQETSGLDERAED